MFRYIFFVASYKIIIIIIIIIINLHASVCQSLELKAAGKAAPVYIPGLKSMRIINGELADIKQFPYLVSLQYNGTFYGHDYDHFCCGSIINERWIITTAQCAHAHEPNDFHARVGSSEYYQNGTIYGIEKVLIHPKYIELERDYDVALVKLLKNIEFSDEAKPVELPKSWDTLREWANFSIAGWGSSQVLGKMSDQLLSSKVQKIRDETCQSVYGSDAITDRMFCVFSRGFGPCVGDSGSPALSSDNKLIGLASWSYGCAYENPSVYVKISSIVGWIKRSVKMSSSSNS